MKGSMLGDLTQTVETVFDPLSREGSAWWKPDLPLEVVIPFEFGVQAPMPTGWTGWSVALEATVMAFAVALAVTLLATPLVITMARHFGAMDLPGPRRVHVRRIPRMGGLAIAAGVACGALLTWWAYRPLPRPEALQPEWFVAAAILMLLVGVADDTQGTSASQKFSGQICAALLAYKAGLMVDALSLPGMGSLDLAWLAVPMTVLWIVGVTNAVNLIDGLDGLAAGLCLIAASALLAIFAINGALPSALGLSAAALIGGCLGFLRYNFHPARVFMGDTGSLLLGFLLACLSLSACDKLSTATILTVPIIVLAVPIVDTLACFARRVVNGRSPFSGDLGHVHHLLLNSGYSQRQVALSLYGVSSVFAVLAVTLGQLRHEVFLMAILTGVLILAGLFYSRFRLFSPRTLLAGRRVRRLLDQLETRIQNAPDSSTALREFRRASQLLSLTHVTVYHQHEAKRQQAGELNPEVMPTATQPVMHTVIDGGQIAAHQQRVLLAPSRGIEVHLGDEGISQATHLYARQLLLEPLVHRLADHLDNDPSVSACQSPVMGDDVPPCAPPGAEPIIRR